MTADLRDQLQHELKGTYTLERELGGGGMSHVFVADDDALRRKVVVKVLRPELAEGLSAERFKREIEVAARLQHLHIVPLLAAGALREGALYYTMPLVDGESLRHRLEREGALPISDVMRILRDVATALAYAHDRGVVHRDIKPENILLSHGGAVVADFGIAKAINASRTSEGELNARRSSTLTAAGTSLGTPAYMAPEQAAGDAVDHRADLYALGVVAYEMLAGRPPFEGRTAQQLLAAHATQPPEAIQRRRETTPGALGTLIMQLLEKNPADRPASADDVLRALDSAGPTHGGATTTASIGSPSTIPLRQRGWRARMSDPAVLVGALIGVGAAAALTAVLAWRQKTPNPMPVHARLPLDLPANAKLNIGGAGNSMALSPDGSTLVYVGGSSPRLFVRRLDSLTSRMLPGTELASNPRFSPDGHWIAFRAGSEMKKVPVSGGPATHIANGAGRVAWGKDGTIVFTKLVGGFFSGLWRVSDDGGTPEQIVAPNSVTSGNSTNDLTPAQNGGSPTILPDGETVLFTALSRGGELTLAAVRIHEHKVVPLGIVGGSATYMDGGYLLFSRRDGSINAVRFDAKRLRVIGESVRVLDSVAVKPGGAAELMLSDNGTLAYVRGVLGAQLVEVDRHGTSHTVIAGPRSYGNPRVSPDGKRIALSIGEPYSSDIWLYDVASATLAKLSDFGNNGLPEWTPDGRRVAWTSVAPGREGIWWRPWDRSGPAELLVPKSRGSTFAPHGDFILTSFDTPNGPGADVRLVPLPFDAQRPSTLLLPGNSDSRIISLSPNGQWLAYLSDDTGMREVYVRRIPGPGPQIQVSTGGGGNPRWSPNGRELFYYIPACCMMSATIATTPELAVARRDSLFPVLGISTSITVTPDGNHFVTARLNAEDVTGPILVFGFADEVRARVAAANRR